MKKFIAFSFFLLCFSHCIPSASKTTASTITKVFAQKTVDGVTSLIAISPEEALKNPLKFTHLEADGKTATLEVVGFLRSNGSKDFYPLPARPELTKLAHLPKDDEYTLTCVNVSPLKRAIYMLTTFRPGEVSSGDHVSLQAKYAFNLPLDFTVEHKDGTSSNLRFSCWEFLKGERIEPKKLPRNATQKTFATLPEYPDETPSYKPAIPLELSGLQSFKPIDWHPKRLS